MDFETVDKKFRDREVLTDEEKKFLNAEYQKRIRDKRVECMNYQFCLRDKLNLP